MLVVLRIVAILVVLVIGGSLAAFMFTRDRRFLRFAWQTFRYAVLFAAVMLLLLALERGLAPV